LEEGSVADQKDKGDDDKQGCDLLGVRSTDESSGMHCLFAERAMVVGCLGQAPLTYHSTMMKCMAADRAQRFTTS